jgi:DNA-binding CsgD family transcriptional regulator
VTETFDEHRIGTIATEVGEALELAALGAESWELPLTLLNAAFPNAYFALVNQDFLNNRVNQAVSCNIDPSLLASYAQYYAFINPYQKRWTALKSGGILSSETMFPVRNISNTEFYNDWLLKAEKCTAGIGLKLDASPTDTIYLPMQSPESHIERYAAACTDILLRLRAPLERAVRICRVQQQAGDAVAGRAVLVTDSRGPAFVVDHSMRIIEANAEAMHLLRRDTLASSRGGRLHFRDRLLSERITLQVRDLASSPAAHVSRIGWDAGNSKWLLSLTRLPADPVQRLLAPRAQILLRLTDLTARPPSGDLKEFARLFRLTPAETRLAAALGGGLSLADAAAGLGITFETARQRLKQVFQKTGTAKQQELCVLITRFQTG